MSQKVKPAPEPVRDFEVVFFEPNETFCVAMVSAGMLASVCSDLLNGGCRIVGICRLGEGPQ